MTDRSCLQRTLMVRSKVVHTLRRNISGLYRNKSQNIGLQLIFKVLHRTWIQQYVLLSNVVVILCNLTCFDCDSSYSDINCASLLFSYSELVGTLSDLSYYPRTKAVRFSLDLFFTTQNYAFCFGGRPQRGSDVFIVLGDYYFMANAPPTCNEPSLNLIALQIKSEQRLILMGD